jgi:hypothetical protein
VAELAVIGPTPVPGPPLGLPPGNPTFAGFEFFVANIMGVPSIDMPDVSVLQYAYDQAYNLTYSGLMDVPSAPTSPSIFAMAVYNLGAHWLVETAQDTPPSTYWQDLRTKFGLTSFTPGLVNAAHDQGTGEGMAIPPYLLNQTLMGLELLKTPWGRFYMMIAGQWGTLWGITF